MAPTPNRYGEHQRIGPANETANETVYGAVYGPANRVSEKRVSEMSQSKDRNRRWVLAGRPEGEPDNDTLRLEESDVPQAGDGQMLLRTEYLSLDPCMRGRLSDAPYYAAPVDIGSVMVGATIAEVVRSRADGFAVGDHVRSYSGWQDYAIASGEGITNLGRDPDHPTWALGVLGMLGFTGWAGLRFIGEPKVHW